MAILRLENGTTYTDLQDIAGELGKLNIQLNQWPMGDHPRLQMLLAQDILTDDEKNEVLANLDQYFQHLKDTAGYQTRDLIVLHPEIPNLDFMLNKFAQCHTHADDEVRYIIAGEGVFGFVGRDGQQMELTVQPAEYINVPANAEHWFHLTAQQRVKAVRYFTSTEGWTPVYTDTPIRIA